MRKTSRIVGSVWGTEAKPADNIYAVLSGLDENNMGISSNDTVNAVNRPTRGWESVKPNNSNIEGANTISNNNSNNNTSDMPIQTSSVYVHNEQGQSGQSDSPDIASTKTNETTEGSNVKSVWGSDTIARIGNIAAGNIHDKADNVTKNLSNIHAQNTSETDEDAIARAWASVVVPHIVQGQTPAITRGNNSGNAIDSDNSSYSHAPKANKVHRPTTHITTEDTKPKKTGKSRDTTSPSKADTTTSTNLSSPSVGGSVKPRPRMTENVSADTKMVRPVQYSQSTSNTVKQSPPVTVKKMSNSLYIVENANHDEVDSTINRNTRKPANPRENTVTSRTKSEKEMPSKTNPSAAVGSFSDTTWLKTVTNTTRTGDRDRTNLNDVLTRGKKLVEKLVIYPELEGIRNMIETNKLCAVVAATGSGKSLGIPNILAEHDMRVCISVPTITAALSLYRRQMELTTFKVGYAAEGIKKYDKWTPIIYGTSGHWRRKLLAIHEKYGKWVDLDFCDVFIVDEVHTGSLDNDLIISMFEDARDQGKKIPKIVLSSATYNETKFPSIPCVRFDVPSYIVKVIYFNRNFDLEESNELLVETCRLVKRIHIEDKDFYHGHILIFVAGSADVDEMCEMLNDLQNAIILPAYAKLGEDEISRIYSPVAPNIRKIIVSTNVAETSVTVPGVGCVIDTMVEKRAASTDTGGHALMTSSISKDSAEQRRGRTGRDRPGVCYRMVTEQGYQSLETSRPDEIVRVPLYTCVLELLQAGFNPTHLLRNKIHRARIDIALSLLKQIGAVEDVTESDSSSSDTDSPDDEGSSIHVQKLPVVTAMGKFAVSIPLSVRHGAALYNWLKEKKDIYTGVVLLALLDCYGPSYFWFPTIQTKDKNAREMAIDSHRTKYFSRFNGSNELVSFYKMWNHMMSRLKGISADNRSVREHCVQYYLNHKKVREVIVTVRQILEILGHEDVVYRSQNEEKAVSAMTDHLARCYSDRWMRLNSMSLSRRERYIRPDNPYDEYTLDTKKAVSEMRRTTPINIISLSDITLMTPFGDWKVITIGLPISDEIVIKLEEERSAAFRRIREAYRSTFENDE